VSPSAAIKAHRVLSLILAFAVKDGRLARNAAQGVALRREVRRDQEYLTHDEVRRLAEAAGYYGPLIRFLAYSGCRLGEAVALRVRRVDFVRARIEIAESLTSVNGHLDLSTPKSHARRWVVPPQSVMADLALLVKGRPPDEFVFQTPRGYPIRAANFRRDVFNAAVSKSGVPRVTPHNLRHTASSLAVDAGAGIKVLQSMLGHKSATLTLDTYGHLLPDRLHEVADQIEQQIRASAGADEGRMTDGDASNELPIDGDKGGDPETSDL
jgi:integrase